METKELKLARNSLKDATSKNITFEEIADIVDVSKKRGTVFYLDKDNAEKDLKKLETFFRSKKRSLLVKELRYSTDNKDYIYEVWVF